MGRKGKRRGDQNRTIALDIPTAYPSTDACAGWWMRLSDLAVRNMNEVLELVVPSAAEKAPGPGDENLVTKRTCRGGEGVGQTSL